MLFVFGAKKLSNYRLSWRTGRRQNRCEQNNRANASTNQLGEYDYGAADEYQPLYMVANYSDSDDSMESEMEYDVRILEASESEEHEQQTTNPLLESMRNENHTPDGFSVYSELYQTLTPYQQSVEGINRLENFPYDPMPVVVLMTRTPMGVVMNADMIIYTGETDIPYAIENGDEIMQIIAPWPHEELSLTDLNYFLFNLPSHFVLFIYRRARTGCLYVFQIERSSEGYPVYTYIPNVVIVNATAGHD
ncbi:uncharacterized protein LOC125771345 [Anopheles funestus]|uniref:uncharacterized protein LOC125771345 n=1 Tax=Anopheles funestus TaxID=62324 RepID=UPI0020C6DB0E|nr:uncharacterized protein LOC125771345 [Anopheles funestus]XP_049297853.1 uncharacterized protein LOC125771345 [Anopheles funestus]